MYREEEEDQEHEYEQHPQWLTVKHHSSIHRQVQRQSEEKQRREIHGKEMN